MSDFFETLLNIDRRYIDARCCGCCMRPQCLARTKKYRFTCWVDDALLITYKGALLALRLKKKQERGEVNE